MFDENPWTDSFKSTWTTMKRYANLKNPSSSTIQPYPLFDSFFKHLLLAPALFFNTKHKNPIKTGKLIQFGRLATIFSRDCDIRGDPNICKSNKMCTIVCCVSFVDQKCKKNYSDAALNINATMYKMLRQKTQ